MIGTCGFSVCFGRGEGVFVRAHVVCIYDSDFFHAPSVKCVFLYQAFDSAFLLLLLFVEF